MMYVCDLYSDLWWLAMSKSAFILPIEVWYQHTDPVLMEDLVGLRGKFELRICNRVHATAGVSSECATTRLMAR